MTKINYITATTLAQWILGEKKASLQIVDVRDADFAGGNIKHAKNIPRFDTPKARTLAVHLQQSKKSDVVFHCFFSQQRGPRAASIFYELVQSEFPDFKINM